ncbi:unnamed protein product [Sphagnum balticum]
MEEGVVLTPPAAQNVAAAAAAIVQAESDPIAERRERLRALRVAAELCVSGSRRWKNLRSSPLILLRRSSRRKILLDHVWRFVLTRTRACLCYLLQLNFEWKDGREWELQQNKHLPPMVPKFEDLVAKTPLETNGAKQIYFMFIICFVCLHSSLVRAFSSHEGTKACASTVYITGYANHGS